MARTSCPSCAKAISNKHTVCPHCDTVLKGLDRSELERIAARKLARKREKLMNQSFLALILFLGSFLYLYSYEPAQDSHELLATYVVMGIGFIWYIINRIQLVFLRKK